MAAATTGTAMMTFPSDTQILVTREFDAPRHLVWRVWTTPELVKRWWGGKRGEVTLAEIDLRVGGRWRYVMTANGGFEVGFHGEYREIVPEERLVHTEVFEGVPDGDAAPAVGGGAGVRRPPPGSTRGAWLRPAPGRRAVSRRGSSRTTTCVARWPICTRRATRRC